MKKKTLIPKAELLNLIADAKKGDGGEEKLWFEISDRILRDWDGVSYKFLDSLTPGQSALVCCAVLRRKAEYDFSSCFGGSEIPARALTALKVIGADEYLALLREIESVFPGQKFPQYAEEIFAAVCKLPEDYFDRAADRFVNGTGMKRLLRDYILEYVTLHPEEFTMES
jgi:hypothetical protein